MILDKYFFDKSLKASAVMCFLEQDIAFRLVSSFKLPVTGELSIHRDMQGKEHIEIHQPGIFDLLPHYFVDEYSNDRKIDFNRLYRNNKIRERQLREYFGPLDERVLEYQQHWYDYPLKETFFRLYEWDYEWVTLDKMLGFYRLPPGTTALLDWLSDFLDVKLVSETLELEMPVFVPSYANLGNAVLGEDMYVGGFFIAAGTIIKVTVILTANDAFTEWCHGGRKRIYLQQLLAHKVPVEWEVEIILASVPISGIFPARLGFNLFVS
ncbi:hypothetical protein ACE38W_05030 [Chitinophaga sp. Hz27]|uniref:hypothetical protein n=1 Tax=Chitinophaga sp. Hz27 TaxID=3347169 RepID=UPI0035DCEE11